MLLDRITRVGISSKVRRYCAAKTLETPTTTSNSTANAPKTPLLQKWITYWKSLLNDYKDVMVEAAKHAKDHPVKSTFWLTIFSGAYTCGVMNPDENSFRAQIVNYANDLIFIGKPIRNQNTVQFLQTVESYYNSGQIRYISLGIFSVILRDFKTSANGVYKDNCSFTQPTYLEIIRDNVIDVGFFNKWWILESKMIDCDVNETDWK
ncbi:mitochondrial import inner membrane translocase subunit Tim29 [Planococcus citri]|uniref:mitochondrial import inner membrane translocase subunit Tim29 n=1 Tax=Planococcus citri TaxID=170843 RepID=UPI0031F80BAF